MGAPAKRRAGGDPPLTSSKGNGKPQSKKNDKSSSRNEQTREPREKVKQKPSVNHPEDTKENDPRYGTAPVNKNMTQPPVPCRRKILDTSLLARGMTARTIGVRVANSLKALAPSEIEKDIRHMEAYGAACISYAQQLFAFSNRELVARGHYGPVPPAPGMTFTQSSGGQGPNGMAQPLVTMPVRIDPEEEKRLAILRKRVAASEAKREVLETEYLSLRAHYVHESHKLRRARSTVTGQLKFLRELLKRRGQVLALRRVKCAVAKDILECLEYRSHAGPTATAVSGAAAAGIGGDASDKMDVDTGVDGSKISGASVVPTDLTALWELIESQLQEAELACTDIETPEELQYIKAALYADATALEAANEAALAEKNRRCRSPIRSKEGEEDEVLEKELNKKKKPRMDRVARRGSETGSMTLFGKVEMDHDENVIPWNCRALPRTPYGVALYLSNLSSSPDLAAAFSCDSLFGSAPQSLVWLERNLPTYASPGAEQDRQKLEEVKEEIELLQIELQKEVEANSKLRKEAIEGKKQNDQICAMMSLVRSETEAVVLRHNQILEAIETFEDRKAYDAADVETRQQQNDDEDDGTVVADDEDGQDGFGVIVSNFLDNSDASDDDDDDQVVQPIREVIVPSQNGPTVPGSIKRGFSDAYDNSDPDKKRRKVHTK